VREESYSQLHDEAGEERCLPGEAFQDRYALVGNGPLGEGTFGLVWRCAPRSGRGRCEERAAKIVNKPRLRADDIDRILGPHGEVQTHLALKHPHVVELFEHFDEPQTLTLVLEQCPGGDLFDAIMAISQGPGHGVPEPAAAAVARQLLSGLAYVHGQRVVHRDVKCENILLGRVNVPLQQNVVKICDFGFATRDTGDGLSDLLGSPDTVAPEVVGMQRYSFPVDIWSAGVIIYMMLSARSPFYASTDAEVLARVRTGKYNLSGRPWCNVSSPAKSMITSLMTFNPSLRPTAAEALKNLWLEGAAGAP